MQEDVAALFQSRTGHFLLESGHHGTLWLDLERLCLNVAPVERLATELARRLRGQSVEAVCGPLVEGAFVAMLVARALDVPFTYAERIAAPHDRELYPVQYRVPRRLRRELQGPRVAIVNDVIGGGSAVRGTFKDLQAGKATVVAVGALAVFGAWAETFTAEQQISLSVLATFPNTIWEPASCPLCAAGEPLEDPLGGS